MAEKDKLHTGELYLPNDPYIMEEQEKCLERLYIFNHLAPTETEERERLMGEMFAKVGEGTFIQVPFFANWGGAHCHLGKNVYFNFNVTLVDDTHIYIGDNTMLGPNVVIATAGHPLNPELRRAGYQYNMPVRIGKNCWIGAGCLIMPGVSVGDNTVIGAGSVVTKDLPSQVLAYGNPCRMIRQINAKDREFYFKQRTIPQEIKDQYFR